MKKPSTAKMFRCRFKCKCLECTRGGVPWDTWQYTMAIANDAERAKKRLKEQNPQATDIQVFFPKAG